MYKLSSGWKKYTMDNIELLHPLSYYILNEPDREIGTNVVYFPPIHYNSILEKVNKCRFINYNEMEFYIYGLGNAFDIKESIDDELYFDCRPLIIKGKYFEINDQENEILSKDFYVYFERYDWMETKSEGCGGETNVLNKIFVAETLEDIIKFGFVKEEV